MASRDLTARERALFGPRDMKPHGSAEWCWQTIELLRSAYGHLGERWRSVDRAVDELRGARAWDRVPPERPYGSLDAMLRAEIGVGEAELRARVRSAAEDEAADLARPNRQGERTDLVSNRNEVTGRPVGTTRQRALRHLRTARPDLHARVLAGELTPHGGMVAAGLRKQTVTVPLEPAAIARVLRRRLSDEQLAALVAALTATEE